MIQNFDKCRYICRVTGKPVLAVTDKLAGLTTYFSVDEYKSYNPGNHIYENFIHGRDITTLLHSVSGFNATSAGFQSVQGIDDLTLTQKIESLAATKIYFPNHDNFIYVRIIT